MNESTNTDKATTYRIVFRLGAAIMILFAILSAFVPHAGLMWYAFATLVVLDVAAVAVGLVGVLVFSYKENKALSRGPVNQ